MRLLPLARLAAVAGIALACGEGGDNRQVASSSGRGSCRAPDDTVVARAVTEFVKQVVPTPQRYLATVASDSAIPDLARVALQDKGPTYLYPPDSALRAKVVQKLISVGDYTAMAVVYHGTDVHDGKHAVVKLGGHFVDVGKGVAPSVTGQIQFTCDSTKTWKVVGKSPSPAPAATPTT